MPRKSVTDEERKANAQRSAELRAKNFTAVYLRNDAVELADELSKLERRSRARVIELAVEERARRLRTANVDNILGFETAAE